MARVGQSHEQKKTVQSEDAVTWRVHPARERLPACCLAVVIVAAFGWLAADWAESFWGGIFSSLFFLITLSRFFFPTQFRVDDIGVTANYPLKTVAYSWGTIRRFLHDARGGFLSTRRRRSVLDTFQGLHLVFQTKEHSETIVARITAQLEVEAATRTAQFESCSTTAETEKAAGDTQRSQQEESQQTEGVSK